MTNHSETRQAGIEIEVTPEMIEDYPQTPEFRDEMERLRMVGGGSLSMPLERNDSAARGDVASMYATDGSDEGQLAKRLEVLERENAQLRATIRESAAAVPVTVVGASNAAPAHARPRARSANHAPPQSRAR